MKTMLDISVWNNITEAQYDQIARDYEGVIMRIGYTGYGKPAKNKVIDTKFEKHDKALRARGVKLGVYWYGTDESPKEAVEAAKKALAFAKGRDYPLGVFYDTEDNHYQSKMGKDLLTKTILGFTDYIKANSNYIVGVYASSSWFKNKLHFNQLKDLIIWEANYSKNDGKKHDGMWYDCHLHQYTSNHYIQGGRFDDNIVRKQWWNVETPKPNTKPTATVAREVIAGKWGNGNDRKERLTKAGYNYNAVQDEVNKQLKTPLKPIATVAKEVIAGKWGNGTDRKERLTKAGYDYNAVQAEVNRQLGTSSKKSNEQIANEVIRGEWGNNPTRRQKLKAAGYDPDAVQAIVNKKLG